ncbi:hypothetical protein A8924_3661 [Saccharopolyspora erythraea NRRL 2338]|uniref:Uncharacterized protein n=2 Tax=Saccharopolyspora erythraea TaxID=1836 RepID=A4FER8_SACEN|nr:hypothetical protein [Saccharopolyspora erythraea]EQD81396.1 hypothetical protein N599_36450 [Saccharopolyspora erythraea D]PFG96268.1 hypothetical protein A8924_3661 [Saccharopolyspora erythraea NRRL 2338]QRK92788.1 hypothetical protein JQX30_16740 [Saccharopolyspora erythraea]CAM02543.1 hypothetical protein SACE_3268 [Saccharopolyspora erythraea NRRL 2338]
MARDAARSATFGRIDPFCWVLVAPMLLVGGVAILLGVLQIGIGLVGIAALVLVFDSWVNRPRPEDALRPGRAPARRPAASRTRAPRGDEW